MAFCEQDMEMNKMSPDFIFCVPLKLSFLIAFLRHPKSDLNAWLRWWHSRLQNKCVGLCLALCFCASVNMCGGILWAKVHFQLSEKDLFFALYCHYDRSSYIYSKNVCMPYWTLLQEWHTPQHDCDDFACLFCLTQYKNLTFSITLSLPMSLLQPHLNWNEALWNRKDVVLNFGWALH